MFHVELRQFPHVARAFNLTRDQLDAQILRPLATGRPVMLNEQRFSPAKVKVKIYEGPELAVEELGMGRGWGNATKGGEDVTDRLLTETRAEVESPPALEELKQAVVARSAGAPLGYEELLEISGRLAADLDANQRVGLAARAVWELLREGRIGLSGP